MTRGVFFTCHHVHHRSLRVVYRTHHTRTAVCCVFVVGRSVIMCSRHNALLFAFSLRARARGCKMRVAACSGKYTKQQNTSKRATHLLNPQTSIILLGISCCFTPMEQGARTSHCEMAVLRLCCAVLCWAKGTWRKVRLMINDKIYTLHFVNFIFIYYPRFSRFLKFHSF